MSPLVIALLALDMSGAARDLAREVAAVVHEPVSLSVRNLSTLAPGDAAGIRTILESELRTGGQVAAQVELTISENVTQFVLVAEIRRGAERQVLLESWPRAPAARRTTARVTLDKKLLWEQDQAILDALRVGDTVLVLDAARVLMIRDSGQQSAPVSAGHPWPRDLRGHLAASDVSFTAWLPGTVCRGSLQPQLTIECRDSQDPWLIAPGALATFSPSGNLFTGHIAVQPGGARELPPFYSAAPAGDFWVVAAADGRAHVYAPAWEAAGDLGGWGSDLAVVQTPCGERILATRPTTQNEADAIQPFQISGGAATPTGPAVEFAGPVTALWAAGSGATAVSRDLETGQYAAFSLSPACGS